MLQACKLQRYILKISNFRTTNFRNAYLQNPNKNLQFFFSCEILKFIQRILRTARAQSE